MEQNFWEHGNSVKVNQNDPFCRRYDLLLERYQCILSTSDIFTKFARYSGLRVNDEKTEIFATGPHSLVQDVFTHKIRAMIKILGVYFNYDTRDQP